jgi:hypothetical protein
MQSSIPSDFDQRYQSHLKHLKLKGLQPKTIDAYARAIRRMGDYFDHQIDNLSSSQLTDYFSDLITTHSWSAVKLDLYGFKFYTVHVLGKPWTLTLHPPHQPHQRSGSRVHRLLDEPLHHHLGERQMITMASIYLGRYLYRGVIQEKDIVRCEGGHVTYRWRDSKTKKMVLRTVTGATFLRLVLQHVLPKGLRRARNFGFLHPNSKRLIALLQLLVFQHPPAPAATTPRPQMQCVSCGCAMVVIRRPILPTMTVPPLHHHQAHALSN